MTEGADDHISAGEVAPPVEDAPWFASITVTSEDALFAAGLVMAAFPVVRRALLLVGYRARRRRILNGAKSASDAHKRAELNAAHGAYSRAKERYEGVFTALQVLGLALMAIRLVQGLLS